MSSALKNDQLSTKNIQRSLTYLAGQNSAVAAALDHVGYPAERRRPHGFEALVSIIVGQQLSTKAAAAISKRLSATLEGELTPARVRLASDSDLRAAGLSGQKVGYLRALTAAIQAGDLRVEQLPLMADADVVRHITAVKGFGVWSAHMYLMFSLGRADVWPIGDLAIRAGFGRLMGLDERPTPKQTQQLAEPFSPHRSALALLCWRVYSEAPL